MARQADLRLLGVSVEDLRDRTDPLPAGKWSQFFAALARRAEVTATLRATAPRSTIYLNLAASFHPNRARWLAQAGFSRRYAHALSASLERQLQPLDGTYDLIVQLQTLFKLSAAAPYAIYTDNTFALTQRFYPQWAPLRPLRVRQWLDFEAEVCRDAARVFTFSEYARGSVIDDYGCAPEHVVAVGAGANQLLESPQEKDYSEPVALFVGRPFGLKGGATLLAAWEHVRRSAPDATLLIAGPRGRAPRDLPAGVSWLGRVDRATLARLYARARVFVLPTMYDAWGHVFVEAMGYALPCIGTNAYAIPEIVQDGVSGILVPREEPEPLADALTLLLSDADRAATMGRAGYERMRELFTWNLVAQRFLAGLPMPATQ